MMDALSLCCAERHRLFFFHCCRQEGKDTLTGPTFNGAFFYLIFFLSFFFLCLRKKMTEGEKGRRD